uniref:Uncharacterized protein n=1 Tax=Rhizophora mucronata TaxID=61149 RepID=A0A2P2QCV5_RHIMU
MGNFFFIFFLSFLVLSSSVSDYLYKPIVPSKVWAFVYLIALAKIHTLLILPLLLTKCMAS